MGNLTKEQYDAIKHLKEQPHPHVIHLEETEYALVSAYTPIYSGYWSWEENIELIVVDREGNMFHLTIWTDKYDIDYPIEYNYQLRYFYTMLADDPSKYFEE